MTLQNENHTRLLDRQGWQLLRLLQENARLSFRLIGEAIGLSAPAVAERVHRLQDAGIIAGFHADIDLEKAGLTVQAFIHLTSSSHQSQQLRHAIAGISEVQECYCVTGAESYILKVAVSSVKHLENLLMSLKTYGEVRTSVVLSAQLTRRIIDDPQQGS